MMSLGIHPSEKQQPQRVVIDVTLTCAVPKKMAIDDVVDYDKLSQAIVAICTARHVDLLEELADSIADHCLGLSPVTRADITIAKPEVAKLLGGQATPMIRWVKKRG